MENSLQNSSNSPLQIPFNKQSSVDIMQGFSNRWISFKRRRNLCFYSLVFNSRKVSETPNSTKVERQRSPNSSRRHIQSSSSGSNSSGLTPNTLALPVTPAAHSTASGTDDKTLTNMSSIGQQDFVATPCAPSGSSSKATDDPHADDDQVLHNNNHYAILVLIFSWQTRKWDSLAKTAPTPAMMWTVPAEPCLHFRTALSIKGYALKWSTFM